MVSRPLSVSLRRWSLIVLSSLATGIYRSALGSGLLHARGAEDAVKVVLARVSYERRRVETSEGEFYSRRSDLVAASCD